MQKIIIIGMCILLLVSGCILQDTPPIPTNYSSQIIEVAVVNETNHTNITKLPPIDSKTIIVSSDNLVIYILDMEKSGSYILTLHNHSMLINAQGDKDALTTIKALNNIGIQDLDYLILTNNREENIAGAPSIILREKPISLIQNGISSGSYTYKQYNEFFPNATILPFDKLIFFDDANVNLFVPYDDGLPLTDDNSFLVKINYGSINLLFATDCQYDCESRVKNKNINSKILISNGACDSLSLAFLLKVSPELVIFSGSNVCQTAYDRVANLGISLLSTKNNGDIIIAINSSDYDYFTAR